MRLRQDVRVGVVPAPEWGPAGQRTTASRTEKSSAPKRSPDVSFDWDVVRCYSNDSEFRQVNLSLWSRKLYGRKGPNVETVGRFGDWMRGVLL